MIKIKAIKAFTDNYIWLVTTNEGSLVIDPGESKPVIDYLKNEDIFLDNILITHHHFDHTGGLSGLIKHNKNISVIGPNNHIEEIKTRVKGDDCINVIGLEFIVISVPGHTLDHIAFYCENGGDPILFCGDTMFAGGCGRIFEGTYDQMYKSLMKLKNLPSNTKVYCAHEYTEQNLNFANCVEPLNNDIVARLKKVSNQRELNKITLPSSIGEELKTNPFLRCDKKNIRESIFNKYNIEGNDTEIFEAVRNWKDTF